MHDDRMDGDVAVRELWSRLLETLETGDASAWADALADDALVIGTDDAEWWQGKAAAVSVNARSFRTSNIIFVRFYGVNAAFIWELR